MSEATNRISTIEDIRPAAVARDGLLGWMPAIVLGYATILTPLFLQQTASAVGDPSTAAQTQGSNLANQIFWILILF
ncbi:hypothetical protein N7E02_02135 (plasmid) [Aliirhizobium terrae]|uniref:hypothetical protein n=1 Tax=Terrirhizobium terrae TaxID=2926709 RepID=UPI0025751495|nr:hypothetical protein [Rhizobium sp. CC-CFT758]WJH37655.1 hypothetical protein N7E02_02135 [Rhizobium sp. CC-CFT758]